MKCPYCNSEISDDSLFCGACGKKLPLQKECVKCGKPIDANSEFCPYCGARQNSPVSTPREGEKPLTAPSPLKQSKISSRLFLLLPAAFLHLQ